MPKYDLFISHASEDKDDFVRPLALTLLERGWQVWYDELTLRIGDSLRKSIDKGLRDSRHGLVVLSPNFFAKNWTDYELTGLTTKEMVEDEISILPIWHKVSHRDVAKYSLTLADRVALNSAMDMDLMIAKLSQVVGPPALARRITGAVRAFRPDIAHLETAALSGNWVQSPCPKCEKPGDNVGFDVTNDIGPYTIAWFQCRSCGYREQLE
jgi:hypothetical protein